MKTREEFAEKLGWEGGAEALANYGGASFIDDYDFDKDAKHAWQDFVEALDNLYIALADAGIEW